MNEKILNIKISEEDYNLIIVALISTMQRQEENVKLPVLTKEERENIEANKEKYKKIITKLKVCKLYNE